MTRTTSSERCAFFGENATNSLDRAPRLFLDRSGDHVAVGVLGDLPETKMKSPARTAGWNGRFGFFFPIGYTSFCDAARVVHGSVPHPNAVVSMMSTPRMRSTR